MTDTYSDGETIVQTFYASSEDIPIMQPIPNVAQETLLEVLDRHQALSEEKSDFIFEAERKLSIWRRQAIHIANRPMSAETERAQLEKLKSQADEAIVLLLRTLALDTAVDDSVNRAIASWRTLGSL